MTGPRAKTAISLILAAALLMPQSALAEVAGAGSDATESSVASASSVAAATADTSSGAAATSDKQETIEEIYLDNLPASGEPDADEYDGFIYKMKDSASRSDVRRMERRIASLESETASETGEAAASDKDRASEAGTGDAAASASVETVVEGEVYRADSLETIEEVAEPDDIEYIEPDYIRSLAEYSATPDDTYFDRQKKALELLEIPKVWEQGYFGSGTDGSVTVAVLDSGVSEHPDLKNVLPGRRFLKGEEVNYEGDIDKHGTMVAGIIGAENNNGIGVSGAMPGVQILPICIFERKGEGIGASVSDIVKGIDAAAEAGADVINMSFGAKVPSKTEREAVARARSKGVILVAASGNEGVNSVMYPAAYSEVIAVGALDEDGVHADYSNYGSELYVAAPGTSIASTNPSSAGTAVNQAGEYGLSTGTSMSTPFVSALAAMAKSVDSEMTPSECETVIKQTAYDLGDPGFDNYYGWGLPSFARVLNALTICRDGHAYGEWETVKQASYLSDGTGRRTCASCGTAETRTIYKIGSVSFNRTAFAYNGKVQHPVVTGLVDRRGVSRTDIDYSATLTSPASSKVGTYRIKVTLKGDYAGTRSHVYRIPPRSTSITGLTRGRRSLRAKWSRRTEQVTGYQLRYSTSSKMNGAKTVTVKGARQNSRLLSRLKSGRRYYVQVRTYKTVNGTRYYSAWSGKKSARTR